MLALLALAASHGSTQLVPEQPWFGGHVFTTLPLQSTTLCRSLEQWSPPHGPEPLEELANPSPLEPPPPSSFDAPGPPSPPPLAPLNRADFKLEEHPPLTAMTRAANPEHDRTTRYMRGALARRARDFQVRARLDAYSRRADFRA